MNRATISIANLHDGITLTAEEAEMIAGALLVTKSQLLTFKYGPKSFPLWDAVVNILRSKRRDGSEPEEAT